MRIKSIILLIVGVLAITAPGLFAFGTLTPNESSCRVTPRPVGFPGGNTEVRTLQPYTGTEPLTHISIDCCFASFARCAAENRTPFPFGEGLQVQWQHADMRLEVAFDADFKTTFIDTTLTHPTIGFVFPSYDGATDFAGPSGTMHENFKQTLVTVEADVDDPSFFLAPFQVWFRMSSPDGVTSFHEGLMTSTIDQLGSVGLVFKFNGIAPP